MTDITLADVSEFQKQIDFDAYLNGGHDVIIARVHNGYRADHMMPERIDQIRARRFKAVGYYIYLVKDRPATQQTIEMVGVIQKLRPNEFPIVDHEEGSGNQIDRAEAALSVLDGWAGFPATLYAGAAFMDAHLGGRARWRRPRWIASYPNTFQPVPALEPKLATFWQYSDRASFPGIAGGVDASIFHGSSTEFLTTVIPTIAPPAPVPLEEIHVVKRPDGGQELFAESRGAVWHCWQKGVGGPWSTWSSLGSP